MMMRRSDDLRPGSLITRPLGLWRKFRRHQTVFSLASSFVATVLVVLFIITVFGSRNEIGRNWAYFWLATFAVFSLAPLISGFRFQRGAGLLLVLYFSVWSAVFAAATNFGHTELNVFLQMPVIALYLGWFYPPWFARGAMLVYMALIVIAVLVRPVPFADDEVTYVAMLYAVLIAGFCLEAGSHIQRSAENRALRDPLTKVLNRRGMGEKSVSLMQRAVATGSPLTLVVADFDDFKAVNDTGGHAAGDAALQEVSASWVEGFPPPALIARTGGDEFVLMVLADSETTRAKLQQIRSASAHAWSWGLTQMRPGDTIDSLMLRADNRMYRMKGHDGEVLG